MLNSLEGRRSKWLSDLIRFLPLKSQFVLSGNVRDLQIENKENSAVIHTLSSCLAGGLRAYGYSHVLCYDIVNGFKSISPINNQQDNSDVESLMKKLGLQPINGRALAGLELFEEALDRVIAWKKEPIALIIDFASRLITHHNELSSNEHFLFTRALVRSHEARVRAHGSSSKPFFNTILWVVEKEGDMPAWLTVDNSKVRHISIPNPDHQMRRILANTLLQSLEGAKETSVQLKDLAIQNIVDKTDGLLLVDLMLIVQLCREEKLGYAKIGEAVRRYKVGVSEDPWQKIDRCKIHDGENFIMDRV